jgi:hypothetical protein
MREPTLANGAVFVGGDSKDSVVAITGPKSQRHVTSGTDPPASVAAAHMKKGRAVARRSTPRGVHLATSGAETARAQTSSTNRRRAEVILCYANFSVPEIAGDSGQSEADEGCLSGQAAGLSVLLPASDDGSATKDWRIPPAQRAEVLRLGRQGLPILQIAQRTAMAFSTARLILDSTPETTRPVGEQQKMSADDVEEARGLRAGGMTLSALGQRYGVTRQAVTKRLGS